MVKNFKIILTVFGFMGIVLFSSQGFAQSSSATTKPSDTKAQLPPGMDEATMAKIKEYSTPNDNHKVLDHFVGSWDYSMKWWMSPDAPPEESTGTSEVKSIFGGRFIEETVNGTSMGQPFEGRGVTGFDNVKKEYTATWMDNMATGIMTSSGTYDPATKILTEKGSFSCPIKNGPMAYRGVLKIIDDNKHVYEMYNTDKDGKEVKAMELTYTRKK